MPAPLIRPRTVPEILDAAFQLLRRHYVPIVTATGLILLPAIVLGTLLPEEQQVGVALLNNFLLNFASAATVVMVADVYLGREPSVAEALKRVGGRAGPIFAAAVCTGVLILVGVLLCVIPGIFAYALLFAVPIVVMVEEKGPLAALERSVALADGHLLRILGTAVLAQLIVLAAAFGLGLAAGVLEAGAAGAVADVLVRVLPIFLYPFPVVVSTLLYFDIRIRKEGFGMDDLGAWVDQPAPPGPA